MKRLMLIIAVALAATAMSASAGSTPDLKTFGTGHVFTKADECATFNDSGEYGGCYRNKASTRPLGNVLFSFDSEADTGGGAPRFSVPIDRTNDGASDVYAFIDVNGCGSTHVATDSANCQVFLNDGGYYANWQALVSANPSWTLAKKEQTGTKPNGSPIYEKTMPFIIADVAGAYLVTNIVLSY